MNNYFPDFEGNGNVNSVEDIKAFIENRFLSLNQDEAKQIEVVYSSFIDDYSVDTRNDF